jgi:hypothetical protein
MSARETPEKSSGCDFGAVWAAGCCLWTPLMATFVFSIVVHAMTRWQSRARRLYFLKLLEHDCSRSGLGKPKPKVWWAMRTLSSSPSTITYCSYYPKSPPSPWPSLPFSSTAARTLSTWTSLERFVVVQWTETFDTLLSIVITDGWCEQHRKTTIWEDSSGGAGTPTFLSLLSCCRHRHCFDRATRMSSLS